MRSLDAAETELRKMGQAIADIVAKAYEDRTERIVFVRGWSNVAGPLALRRAVPMIYEKMASCPRVRILLVDLNASNQYNLIAEIRKLHAETLELGLHDLPPPDDRIWRERRSELRDLFLVVVVNIVDSILLRRILSLRGLQRHRYARSIILIPTKEHNVTSIRTAERISVITEELRECLEERHNVASRLYEQLRKLTPKFSTDGDANIVERYTRLKDSEWTITQKMQKIIYEDGDSYLLEEEREKLDNERQKVKVREDWKNELKRYANEGFQDARELLRLEERRWALEEEWERLWSEGWDTKRVEGSFDDLSTEAALGLLQLESKAAAESLQQWCDNDIVEGGVSNSGSSQRIRLRMPIINDGTILKCCLYSAIVPDVCNPVHFWRIEGLFGGSGNDQFDHSQKAAAVVRAMIEEMVSRGILQVVDDDIDDYRVCVPEPLTEKAQSIAAALMMIKSDENDSKSQKILFHSRSPSHYNLQAKQNDDWLNQLVVGGPVPTMSQSLSDCHPNLHTLVIKDNDQLVEISDNVFSPNMPSMRILDLSGTRIRKLPSSLLCCPNLKMLSLNYCTDLESIHPAVGEKGLAHLEVISVISSPLLGMRKLSLSKHQTLHLKTLCFADAFHNLKELFLCVNNCRVFDEYFASGQIQWPKGRIKRVQISVIDPSHQEKNNISNLSHHSSHPYHNILPRHNLPDHWTNTSTHSGHLEIHGGQEDVLFHNLVSHIFFLLDYIYISDNQAEMTIDLGVLPYLSHCRIQRCHQIKIAFLRNKQSSATNSVLKTVHISDAKQLRLICRFFSSNNGTLLSLTKVHVEYCPNLVALFQGSTIELPMLHELRVRFCSRLRSIFDQTMVVAGAKEDQTCLPSLKKFHLCQLPQLVSICAGHIAAIEELKVRDCWKLYNLPLKTTRINTVDNITDMVIVDGELKWWNCVVNRVDFDKKKINFRHTKWSKI